VGSPSIDAALLEVLSCPRDGQSLAERYGKLVCPHGHTYPIVEGVPVFLLAEKEQTIGIAGASLKASSSSEGGPLYLDSVGLSPDERSGIERDWKPDARIDAVISYLIGATSGWGYVNLIGKLEEYPIPDIPIEKGCSGRLLDVGCNWGRWSVSAARKGWKVIGLDPSLGALMAAKRAFGNELPKIAFVCGDARFLPFRKGVFAKVFSYSVIQHFSEADADTAIAEIGRVLGAEGIAKIQMAHRGGFRSTYIRTRPDYMGGGPFRVRYWSLSALREMFSRRIGPTSITPEAYGGLGVLPEDWRFVGAKMRALIGASVALKAAARAAPPLVRLADSVYVTARKASP
jgi:SAM-dependent methyltransferase/uncharacterized protein YbaR (Trm112 family)